MTSSASAVETHDLRKEYGATIAVASLSIEVERGEVFGFLGPNGAGKTTAIKMMLGLTKPTSGRASILGVPISDPESRRRVGFLPEHFRFHEWMRGAEFLDIHGRLHGVPRETLHHRVPELLELVGLAEAAQRQLSTYSKGMLQRIGLAQALINHPEIVFLDEPTSGLDPFGRRMVRGVMGRLREQGTTVFLNSHLLSEVEVTCTRVAFIAKGTIQRVADLRDYEAGVMQVELRVGVIDDDLVRGLGRWGSRVELGPSDGSVRLFLPDRSALPEIVRWIAGRGTDLYSLSPHKSSLEDLFMSIIGEDAS